MLARSRSAILVLSFSAVQLAAQACGSVGNVLEGPPRDELQVDGGAGKRGTGGAPVQGTGGAAGGGGAGPSGTGGSVPVPVEAADLHAAERTALAASLCALPLQHRCLSFSEGRVEDTHVCENLVQLGQTTRFGQRCWTEWATHAACALGRTSYCSCGEAGASSCIFDPWTDDFGVDCSATRAALDACRWGETSGEITGPGGSYLWSLSGEKCQVAATAGTDVSIRAICLGTLDGAQECTCQVGERILESADGAPSVLDGPDCLSIATKLAAGWCTRALDCCFDHNATGLLRCDCVDPEGSGYSACTDLIDVFRGQKVDSCPRYRGAP